MRVTEIGTSYDEEYISQIDYISDDYFLDADILIINLDTIRLEFAKLFMTISNAGAGISEDRYNSFILKVEERNQQLQQYLNKGGNLFVNCGYDRKMTFNTFNGYSNLGQKTIDFFNMVLLDGEQFSTQIVKGQNIIFPDTLFEEFFKPFNCNYEFIYTEFTGYPIATIKTTNQPISLIVPVEKGNVILLPKMKLWAEDYDDFKSLVKKARGAIIMLDASLKADKPKLENIKLPDWCLNYRIGEESEEIHKLELLNIELFKIQNDVQSQLKKLEYYERLKLLFAGTGKPLEIIVEEIFLELGYEILPREPNRDDLIIRHNGQVAVMEIKGVKGSAAERNATQLMKWVTTYHSEHEIKPKGILLVNAFKDKPLSERMDRVFPYQMIPYCKQMEICLLTGSQLLELYLDVKTGVISLGDLHNLLFNNTGELEYRSQQINLTNVL